MDPLKVCLLVNMEIFHWYVSLPEGKLNTKYLDHLCMDPQVVDKDNRILELLKGTNSAQTLAARLGHSCGVVMCRRPRVARKWQGREDLATSIGEVGAFSKDLRRSQPFPIPGCALGMGQGMPCVPTIPMAAGNTCRAPTSGLSSLEFSSTFRPLVSGPRLCLTWQSTHGHCRWRKHIQLKDVKIIFGFGVDYASIAFLSVTSIINADPTLACLGGDVHHQKQEAEFKKRLGRRKGQHAGDSRIVMDHTYISFGELGSRI